MCFSESPLLAPGGLEDRAGGWCFQISSHYTSIYMTDRTAVYEKWALTSSEANPFSWEKPCPSWAVHNCVRSTPIMARIELPLYFRANKTSLNCLTNICMSLFVLSNTLLSNWAPPPSCSILGCLQMHGKAVETLRLVTRFHAIFQTSQFHLLVLSFAPVSTWYNISQGSILD